MTSVCQAMTLFARPPYRKRICFINAPFITGTGAFFPVHISKAMTPWYNNMPIPGRLFAFRAFAALSSGVSGGLYTRSQIR